MVLPDVKILGPITKPSLIASLSEIVSIPPSPRFLTDVNPAMSVFDAAFAANSALYSGSIFERLSAFGTYSCAK